MPFYYYKPDGEGFGALLERDGINDVNYLAEGLLEIEAPWSIEEMDAFKVVDGVVIFYTPDDVAANRVRYTRDNLLLTEVDPLVSNTLRWADLTAEKQALWTQYRRDLLDITAQEGFPQDVTWPTKPE